MPQPQPRSTHPWAEANEPIPAGYPPVEVSCILAIERQFIDDTRYCMRDLLEARPGLAESAAYDVATAIVDRARREWRAALLASAAFVPRPAAMDEVRAELGQIAERVYHPGSEMAKLVAEVDRLAAAGGRKDAEIAHLNAELAERDARPVAPRPAEVLAEQTARAFNGTAAHPGPGPDRTVTLSAADADRVQRCLDLVYVLKERTLPIEGDWQFVALAPARDWLRAAAEEALSGIKQRPQFWWAWGDADGETLTPPAPDRERDQGDPGKLAEEREAIHGDHIRSGPRESV